MQKKVVKQLLDDPSLLTLKNKKTNKTKKMTL